MNTIWKYPLEITDEQTISIPRDAKILSVQMQCNIPCIWVFVDTENRLEKRTIRIFGTGNECPFNMDNLSFIGTIHERAFVWHVFVVGDNK